jgi:hypothetical protein
VPKSRQRSILFVWWHWPTLTAFGPFWTVARHRMAIVPGDQSALWASADPGGFHALGSVAAGVGEVPDQDPCWPDPAEGERLSSSGPLGCCYLASRSCRLSILCGYHYRAYLRLAQAARVAARRRPCTQTGTDHLNDLPPKIVQRTAACSVSFAASCVFAGLHSAGGWCQLSSRPGVRVPPGALVISVHRGDREPTLRSRCSWFLAG